MSSRRPENWRYDTSVYKCSPGNTTPKAVYFHIPFCRHRCGYCDFTLVAGRDDLIDAYLRALSNELEQMSEPVDVASIFVGGGTPTHLDLKQLERFLQIVAGRFQRAPDGEYTFEANPDGLTQEKIELLIHYGVNRLSLGVQSFDPDALIQLERTHSPDEATETVARVAEGIHNVSIDLIFGVPGQSLESWTRTLTEATRLPINHISTYGLTFEKGTSFFRRRANSELIPATSELEREQYAAAMQVLSQAELNQYEISNFAQKGFRSIHNQVYWDAQEYFAFGPGAARYLGGVRSTNGRNVTRWIESWLNGRPLLQDWERLDGQDRAREAVMLGLRRNEGIQLGKFEQQHGVTVSDLEPAAFARHIDDGLLEISFGEDSHQYLRFTDEGRFLADTVITDFL
jgi:oxygen-independent coproporphyrinogen-3 oxidase